MQYACIRRLPLLNGEIHPNLLWQLIGETIPIRLFLGGFDLTPTFRDVNKKYSTRYYLSLVLIDEGKQFISFGVFHPRILFKSCPGHLLYYHTPHCHRPKLEAGPSAVRALVGKAFPLYPLQ